MSVKNLRIKYPDYDNWGKFTIEQLRSLRRSKDEIEKGYFIKGNDAIRNYVNINSNLLKTDDWKEGLGKDSTIDSIIRSQDKQFDEMGISEEKREEMRKAEIERLRGSK